MVITQKKRLQCVVTTTTFTEDVLVVIVTTLYSGTHILNNTQKIDVDI